MNNLKIFLSAVLMVSLSSIGCQKKSSSSGGGPAPQAAPAPIDSVKQLSGWWEGKADSNDIYLFFYVRADGYIISLDVGCVSSGDIWTGQTRYYYSPDGKINTENYSINESEITGTFISPTAAKGTVNLWGEIPCTDLVTFNWSANKEEPESATALRKFKRD